MGFLKSFFNGNGEPPRSFPLRDTLFGDLPLEGWPDGEGNRSFPWNQFIEARRLLNAGSKAGAIAIWTEIATHEELEVRHILQAWTFLRQNGVNPPADTAKAVLGFVAEVSLPGGLDLLAAYKDHHARYYNYTGSGVVWECADDSLNPHIDRVLEVAQATSDPIGPWRGARPPAPTGDQMRISFLTRGGISFGQGTQASLSSDPLGGQVVLAGVDLMRALIEKTERA